MATTIERLTKLMVDNIGLPHDIIKPEAKLADDLGMSDLDWVEITLLAEDEFGIEFPDDSIDDGMGTVAELVALVDKLAGGRA